jgi:hypothetical protein
MEAKSIHDPDFRRTTTHLELQYNTWLSVAGPGAYALYNRDEEN